MQQNIVLGNWKMNGCRKAITELLRDMVRDFPEGKTALCAVFPPAIYLPLVQEILAHTPIKWGAQNVYPKDRGAYTGELSSLMLKEYGCEYVLVGHSERRNLLHENEKFIAEKFHHVKEHGMIPILCVGESQQERDQGATSEILKHQIHAVVDRFGAQAFQGCVIAYEPVWAIGSGKTASPEQAQEVHAYIRRLIAELGFSGAQNLPILYGGSVNENNAAALFDMPDINGGLVGGASLNAQQFLEIVKCIN